MAAKPNSRGNELREDFEILKTHVRIEDIAFFLLGDPIREMYRYPGERTASVRIYPRTQSFYDFGRGVGGDAIRLWSHVRNCDSWTSLQQIKAMFGFEDTPNNENIRQRIKAQEEKREAVKQDEKRRKKAWLEEVNRLKKEVEMYDNLLRSPRLKPFSDVRGWCINGKQFAEYKLDLLCGIYGGGDEI